MARTQGHGNPNWTWDETVLALELYQACEDGVPSKEDPRVISLSKLLRSLPFHKPAKRRKSFRNPAGVAFKLQNLRQVATGIGLKHVSATDRAVWAKLGRYPQRVARLATSIRKGATKP